MSNYSFSSKFTLEEARDICKEFFDSINEETDTEKLDAWPIIDCANQIMEALERVTALCEVSVAEEPTKQSEDKRYDLVDVNTGVTIIRGASRKVVHVIVDSYDQPIQISIHPEDRSRSVKSYSKDN